MRIDLEALPRIFGETFTLAVQALSSGFAVFINNRYIYHFAHRRGLADLTSLAVELPLTDDSDWPENAVFHKVVCLRACVCV